jgi:glucose/arabinose dehydrogenase
MTMLRPLVAAILLSTSAGAATLPGFRVETLARTHGFVSSIATDSKGTIYFTTTDGWIHRVDGSDAVRVAALPTRAGGNGGLLGMALQDDHTAIVHYTTWNNHSGELAKVLDDVISRVDLRTGAERVLQAFACDLTNRDNGASSEHHGGNPTLGPDGSIFVGIGDYGGYVIAQKPEWNAGKIWRIDAHGNATQWALGLRNPYDMAWDPELGRLVVADNGSEGGDEIHVVAQGDNCGWPHTYGDQLPMDGAVAPVYVWPDTVAPTGLARLETGANPMLRRGYLAGAFVTRALYYFPTFAAAIPIVENFQQFIIDVTQAPNGDVLFASGAFGETGATTSIHRLHVPLRGDCNGDGAADWRDVYPLMQEIGDGTSHAMTTAQDGAYRGGWGCDANADGLINETDMHTLAVLIGGRVRAVRHR